MMDDTPLWAPSPQRVADAHLTRFIERLDRRRGLSIDGYAALHRWSLERPDAFWFEVAHYADVRADWADTPVLRHGERMPGAEWFPGARLNYAENLLHFHDDGPAIIAWDERSHAEPARRRSLTRRKLESEVARIASGLRAAGVVAGDRVVGFLPNIPEAVIAMLAAASIGAVWSSCSPDFGVAGVLDRFGQIAPKVLVTADGYFYAGKSIDSSAPVAGVLAALPSVRTVLVVPFQAGETRGAEVAARLAERLAALSADGAAAPPTVLPWSGFGTPGARPVFERLPFDHPLFVMYSSGTTGVPKCIVHGAGGTLLQHLKEHQLHCDLKRGDRLFFFTTCGWMMWNWLAGALASGATIVLYDGSPLHPDPGALWRMAETEKVTHFGTSPRFLAALAKAGYLPREHVALGALRSVLSTGSPLPPESFDFVYDAVKRDVHLASISGGTDIISCFCLGDPTAPVFRGEIQCAGLGMAVDVDDGAGRPLPVGERGELVCRQPFPSMPLGFWGDPDGARYRKAYFERIPGVWHHGDFVSRTARGGFLIHGRSDAVLNPGGVRIGTAEIYRQVERLPEVLESVCIGQEWQDDVRVVLFGRLRDGVALDDALRTRIRDAIRAHTSPRHVPARIVAVADIPRTLSGKTVELAVREVVHGRPVANTDALANPAALELFRDLPELRA
ncbi:acetoacetate--CoA ligase [Limnohabitans sp.]|uniref:acetoacetate--CoA ligase n=1 Tax=Limnohabitans sp. TaxID=1907725 RepID=UPI003918A061